MHLKLAVGVATTLIAVVAASTSTAAPPKYSSQINIISATPNFANVQVYKGTVASSKAACRRGRAVELYRDGAKVATATTDSSGAYEIGTHGTRLVNGLYMTKVVKKVKRRQGVTKYVCKQDFSNPVAHTDST